MFIENIDDILESGALGNVKSKEGLDHRSDPLGGLHNLRHKIKRRELAVSNANSDAKDVIVRERLAASQKLDEESSVRPDVTFL